MLILAFDTSDSAGSVALLDGPCLLAERALDAQRRSAQTLAPAIAELLAGQGIEPAEIQLVATTLGPGSFTGLRLGVTTAKVFAYAVEAEVIAVSTLEAIACGVPDEFFAGERRRVQTVLDAQRQELFVGRFREADAPVPQGNEPPAFVRLIRESPDQILSAEAWLAELPAGDVVSGTGLKRIEERLPAGVVVVPPEWREVKAAVVGRLAWRDYTAGRRDDLWKLAPVYLRPSYAEEKAARTSTP